MITHDDLWSVTQGCFETQLSMPVDLTPVNVPADRCGRVSIDGAFTGSVTVAISSALAQEAARALFGEAEVGDEDVTATLLELTNMIGGNVKALLAQPSRLGLPDQSDGAGRLIRELLGSHGGQPIVVRVYEGA